MSTVTNSPDELNEPAQDRTFALHALLAFAASLLLCIFLGAPLQLYNLNLGLLITEMALIALPAGVVLLLHRKSLGGQLFSAPRPRQAMLTVMIGGCAVVIAVAKGIAARKALVGIDTAGADISGGLSPFLLVVLAPLCEELLFRPVIQNGLSRHWSNRTAVLVTALLFALFHLQLLRFAETFVIGLFAGIVFLKTRNYWCAVIVHCLCNALGPMLWRAAPQLGWLLNPWTSFGLACLALTGCYYLGARSPQPLRGLWPRLRWAAFGSLASFQSSQKRSPAVAPLTWGIALVLMALLGYGHAATVHLLRGAMLDAKYVVSQADEWTIVSASEVLARSELILRKMPESYEDLILSLPFAEATVNEVQLGSEKLQSARSDQGAYRVDLSAHQDAAREGAIVVEWSFPLTCLTPDAKSGYRTPLKSLAPSDGLSLTVTLADACGWRFQGGNGQRTHRAFSGSARTPTMNYGSCGLSLEREPGHL
ncbi:MAG: CPBP family intramembrane glutamic endopeptidase [Planctomycetota bacterium]